MACATRKDDSYGSGFVTVSEKTWSESHDKPYPFTTSGELSCGFGRFEREVYFEPKGYTNESYVGTPLNEAAQKWLKSAGISSNVPYSIKKGADLSEAIEDGMRLCDEHREMADRGILL